MSYASFIPIFFKWWYGRGLKDLFDFLSGLFLHTKNLFSITTVLKTFFQPWKKMVSSRRPGIDGLKDWLADNLISRAVGIVMRLVMIILFVLSIVAVSLGAIVATVLWVCLPAVSFVLLIYIFISIK